MKILNINKFYFMAGGAERFYFDLAELLEKKGHQVIPLAMQHENNLPSQYGKNFISQVQTEKINFSWQGLRTLARYFWSFEARRKIKKIINIEKPQLAILHNIYHQISPSILPILKKNKIKTVCIAHDYALLSPNYNMFLNGKIYDKICGQGFLKCIPDKCVKNSFIQSLVCALETWFHHSILNVYKKNIDFVICPSKFVQKMFIKAGWDKNKLMHLPYFTKAPASRRLASASRGGQKAHKSQKTQKYNKNYILYFGRLSAEKGVDVLIKAMQHLPEVKLKIVGAGPEETKLKTQSRVLGTKHKIGNVKLLGYKKAQELQELIAGAKFIVVPSIWYEVTGLVILESYYFKKPVLAAKIGGIPEVVKDNNFLFKPGDVKDLTEKIKFLWQNKNVLNQAGQGVWKFMQQYNDAEDYYQNLIKITNA